MNYNDGLLFDLDGTLWDTNENCISAWNILLEKLEYGMQLSKKDMDSVSGKPFTECIDILLPGIRDQYPDIEDLITVSEKEVISRNGGNLYPGMVEGIRKLSDYCKIFIVSNCQPWYLETFIDFAGIRSTLSGWDCFGAANTPKYQMIRNLLKKHSLRKAVYIGDTLHDKESAIQAGTGFIQVTYGFGDPIEGERQSGNFQEVVDSVISRK